MNRTALVLLFALLAAVPAAAAPAQRAPAKRAASAAPAAAAPSARTLDDVHIEGELEVPRVTFITVRQPHRFHDYARPTSVRPAARMAADAARAAAFSPVPQPAPEARKENRK